jgi:signal transduction histidine kinase
LDKVNGAITISALPTVKGVSFQLRQLFLNLIENSIKYRQPGRPLRIEIKAEYLNDLGLGETQTYLPKRFLNITVADNGIGFEKEHSDRIFEMFERLHGRSQYEGTGIGLSICRKIMENHQGYIRAIGYPGEGAVFEVLLPV